MSLFILIFIVLLLIAIYTVALMLSVLFSAKKRGKIFILVALTLISFGFILSQSLVHFFNNLGVRLLYLFSALGVGFLFYLTISAILFQIINLVFRKVPIIILARVGAALAAALFLIGIVNASLSQVKNISVSISGLPKNWQGKKIVQISDAHLGSIYGPKFLHNKILKVNSLEPDLIMITGDLFDGTPGRLAEFESELAGLKAKEGVFYVSGNHDVYLGLDKVESMLRQAGIHVLNDEMVSLNGLEIIGLNYNKFVGNDNNRFIKNLSSGLNVPRLLLNHTPNDILLAKELKVNLQLSGHTHRGQLFPMSFVTRLIYGKYQYGLHTEGTYNIYTSSGLGSWGPPVRTFNPSEIVSIIIN